MKEKQCAVICDLDGTLCNDTLRRHYVASKHRDYDAYHAALVNDSTNEDVLKALRKFADEGVVIIFLTGRPEKYRSSTLDWLMKYDVPTGLLFMKRNDNTMQPAHEFKKEIIKRELKSFDIGFALEDNSKCIEMYRTLGIETIEVHID